MSALNTDLSGHKGLSNNFLFVFVAFREEYFCLLGKHLMTRMAGAVKQDKTKKTDQLTTHLKQQLCWGLRDENHVSFHSHLTSN